MRAKVGPLEYSTDGAGIFPANTATVDTLLGGTTVAQEIAFTVDMAVRTGRLVLTYSEPVEQLTAEPSVLYLISYPIARLLADDMVTVVLKPSVKANEGVGATETVTVTVARPLGRRELAHATATTVAELDRAGMEL